MDNKVTEGWITPTKQHGVSLCCSNREKLQVTTQLRKLITAVDKQSSLSFRISFPNYIASFRVSEFSCFLSMFFYIIRGCGLTHDLTVVSFNLSARGNDCSHSLKSGYRKFIISNPYFLCCLISYGQDI